MFFLTIMQKWNGLNTFFENHLSLYDLAPQADFFGFTFREYFGKHLDDSILQNHLLLVFTALLLEIKKIKCLEKKIAETNGNMHKSYLFKWNKINNHGVGGWSFMFLILYLFIYWGFFVLFLC